MTTFIEPFINAAASNKSSKEARERLSNAELPSRKQEAWKFFNLKPLFERTLKVGASNAINVTSHIIEECQHALVVVRNGDVDLMSSDLSALAEGVFVGSISEAPTSVLSAIESMENGPFEDDFFDLLNRAIAQDVVCVHVPKGIENETPIQVLYTSEGDDAAVAPHALFLLEPNARATIVETSVGMGAYFTTPRTHAVVNDGARLDHVRVQNDSAAAVHIARLSVDVARDAHYDSVSVTFGAKSSRTDLYVTHSGPNGFARIDGLAVLTDGQQSDTHSVVDNWHPHCNSHQLHKCVVDEKAHAIFNGKIFVQKDAQKVDAYQLNRNLLLSDRAKVNTKPQLEIFADDVRCTHGATVGQLDAEQLFYLMSRGASEPDARAMLTYAFAAEVIDHITIDSLRSDLEAEALRRTTRV